MGNTSGKPSNWLLKNSSGYPDFLFTILTYSMLLLLFVTICWVGFGILSFKYAGTDKAETLLKVMGSMQTGLISLVGVVFGLAGSYTVRRFKRDEHTVELQALNGTGHGDSPPKIATEDNLQLVEDEEDI
ncbi:MAG: hypothetical protein DWQ05_01515 [Calditrichaeota bacterium]|nr:MAG: hypothetical protein DWQ05_01515 [Calditrichota bacterium]